MMLGISINYYRIWLNMRTSSCPLFHLPAKLSFCVFYPPNSSSIRIHYPHSIRWNEGFIAETSFTSISSMWLNIFDQSTSTSTHDFSPRSSIRCTIPYCFHRSIWQIPGGKWKNPHWLQTLDASRLHHFARYLPWETQCRRSINIFTSIPNTSAHMPIRFWVLQPLKTFLLRC